MIKQEKNNPFFLHYSSTSEACRARLHNLIVPLDKVLSLENTRENIFFLFFLGILLT